MKMQKLTLMTFLVMILNVSLTATIYAQNEANLDSLEALLQEKIPDTLQANILQQLTEGYKQSNINKSMTYAEQLLEVSEQLNDQRQMVYANRIIGVSYMKKGYDIDTVLVPLQRAIKITEDNNLLKDKCAALNDLATVHRSFGQQEKAHQLLQEALTIEEQNGWKKEMASTLSSLSYLFIYEDEEETAKVYANRALKYAEETNSLSLVARIANGLANIYYDDLDSALIFCKRALEIRRALNEKYEMIPVLANMGHIHSQMGNYNEADKYFQEGYVLAKEVGNMQGLATTLGALGILNMNQEKYLIANDYFEEGLEVLGENGDVSLKIFCLERLSLSYEALRNYKEALYYNRLFYNLNDSIYGLEKNKQIEELQTKYEVSKKETENQLLKAETTANHQTIQNRNRTAIALFLGLLLLGSIAINTIRSNQQKQRYNEELEVTVAQRTKELQQLNYELKTFNYIASHDIKEPLRNIGNYAGLIFKKLPEDLKQHFEFYFSTIKNSTKQLYTLLEDFSKYTQLSKDNNIEMQSVDLNVVAASLDFGLTGMLEKTNGTIINEGLPNVQSNASLIYTILKNIVENGLKYNQSTKPTVTISSTENEVFHQIHIKDNGIGIAEEYHERIFEMFKRLHNRAAYEGSGIGLAIVKLLTDKINGHIQIESELNQGSTFILSIPK